MQAPDGVDRVQYLPPDKVFKSQHTDPDKRQKFSRALEEEEDELEKHRKRRPHDQVQLGSEATSGETSTDRGAADGEETAAEEKTGDGDEETEETKHIDVKA